MSIEIKNISKSFGLNSVLKNFSITFSDNSRTCIMGRSGCGKTTLINLIIGSLKPDSGSIVNVPKVKSLVFQENRLCETFSVMSNIRLVAPKSLSKGEIEKMLNAVGLSDCAEKPVSELSGGMKRRVAIVRALAAPSPIYIMDEPFKGLDEDTKKSVIKLINEKTQDKILTVITHDREDALLLGAEVYEMV